LVNKVLLSVIGMLKVFTQCL